MDVHSSKTRSFNMSKIGAKDTKPELAVRNWLWNSGFRYRLHRKDIPGKPDIVFSSKKKVIFVNGCFWHKHSCKYFHWPKTNAKFWKEKIEGNVKRDNKNYKALKKSGWNYLIVWECDIRNKEKSVQSKLLKYLSI